MKQVLTWLLAGGIAGTLLPVGGAMLEAILSGQSQTVSTDVMMLPAAAFAFVFGAARWLVLVIESSLLRRDASRGGDQRFNANIIEVHGPKAGQGQSHLN